MKKWIATLLTLALLLCGMATLAEADAAARGEIEDGSYVIRIPDPSEDLGWIADDMAQDDSVVKLAGEEHVDGEYVVRYEPVGDGDVSVYVRHYTGIACDEMYGWDLRVKDGAVQESFGGSYAAAPDPAEMDPYLIGEWLEAETQFTQMSIAKNEGGRGWDVEIASPMTHGAYIFKTTIYYDCDLDAFVYDKGKYWEVPITDSDEEVELGEAAVAGTTGTFTFAGDEQDLWLIWYDDQDPEREISFQRADALEGESAADAGDDAAPGHRFVGAWNDGRMSVVIEEGMADYSVTVTGSGSAFDGSNWIYLCQYDDASDSLVSLEGAAYKFDYAYDENGAYSEELAYDDGAAVFTIDADDRLIWEDQKENAGEGWAFVRASESALDGGASQLYSQAEIDEALALVDAEFATWEGCEMHDVRYAGDTCNSEENLQYLNDLREGKNYAQCIEFLTDFHSPVEAYGAWEADTEYTDWQWWLARPEGGSWELVTWGY